MGKYSFDLFHCELTPGKEFHEWAPSWWYRAEGIPILAGESHGIFKWILAGWFLNNDDSNEVINKFLISNNAEYLYELDGQFILSVYSQNDETVEIFRDRVGIFPIAFANGPKGLVLSVDLENARQLSGIVPSVSPAIFEQWPLYRKTFSPFSPYYDMHGLAPENSLLIKGHSAIENSHPMRFPQEEEYADMKTSSQIMGDVLSLSVQKRIDSSKKMGVFLSGGNDSSLVVALVRKYYSGKLRTLFVTFEDNPRDYGNYAQQVADQFATEHSSVELSPNDYTGCWADTIKVLQSPVPMPCHIGIHYALKRLSGVVELMIDGDGADTVFGSSIWPQMLFLSRISQWVPQFLKYGIKQIGHIFPRETALTKILDMVTTALNTNLNAYPHINAAMFSKDEFNKVFLRGDWQQGINFRQRFAAGEFYKGIFSYLMLHGIPEDIATAVRLGLSQRILFSYPFLDYKLLQSSMRLPNRHRYHYRIRKAPLKEYSLRYFDKSFVYKPKEGFGVPLAKWFTRKEFEPFLKMPLEERSIKRGWWKESEVKSLINYHRVGNGSDSSAEALPWILINMELWARICIDGDSPALYK